MFATRLLGRRVRSACAAAAAAAANPTTRHQVSTAAASSSSKAPTAARLAAVTLSNRHIRHASSSSAADPVESAKRRAAEQAVDDFVFAGCRIGIGSGSTIVYAVHRLQQLQGQYAAAAQGGAAAAPAPFCCVPTSFQAQQLILQHGLGLSDLSRTPVLDVVIDGADEVDAQLNCIKGGGGCLLQEKIVAACTDNFVLIADFRKQSKVGAAWRGVA
jgi:ribose 5-phosphate isomerase A